MLNSGHEALPACDGEVADRQTRHYTHMGYGAELVKRQEPENLDPSRHVFQVTQRRRMRHSSISSFVLIVRDFLLVIRSNHGLIWYRFRDKGR